MSKKIRRSIIMIFTLVLVFSGLNVEKIGAKSTENQDYVIDVLYGNFSYDDALLLEDENGNLMIKSTDKVTINKELEKKQLRSYAYSGRYFKSAAIIKSKRGVTLSLDPKYSVRLNVLRAITAWGVLANNRIGFGGYSWFSKNKSKLYNQYVCHAQLAQFKSRWNLDTWLRNASYADTLKSFCNPK